MLRTIYYWLPPAWRLLARRLVYWPSGLFNNRQPMVPPAGLIYTGSGDFLEQGRAFVQVFQSHGLINNRSRVLDIGSGIGRIAVALTEVLTDGTYHGFDAVEQGVRWCRQQITPRHPNFQFTHVDLFNDLYKSYGTRAEQFEFPYNDNSFDFACAISVFTHMTEPETRQYLAQAARVLAPGGTLLATFFTYDAAAPDRLQANPQFVFPVLQQHTALMNKKVVAANVAYDWIALNEAATRVGFERIAYVPGMWSDAGCAHQAGAAFQDILIWRKL
jgi:SAM-dependent methyltransferase